MKTSLKGFKLVVISSAVRGIRRACLAARLKLQVFLSFFFFVRARQKGTHDPVLGGDRGNWGYESRRDRQHVQTAMHVL